MNYNIESLTDNFLFKLVGGAVLAAIIYHAQLLALFMLLVCLDTATKWVALSHGMLDPKSGLWEAVQNIPAAHRARIINSGEMKSGFVTKLMTYMILVFAAFILDREFAAVMRAPAFVSLVVGYLSATEFLSILENLNDAGVTAVQKLLEIIKKKIDGTGGGMKK